MKKKSKQSYSHLSHDERDLLAVLRARGASLRDIASVLKRSFTTLSRELRRNTPARSKRGYFPLAAHRRALARKQSASRRTRLKSPRIRRYVCSALHKGWSPELIAGRLPLDLPRTRISHEAIYQWLYHDARHLLQLLPKRHRKRMRRGYVRGKHSRSSIPQRVPISLRPASVATRRIAGHWEADTAGNRKSSRVLLVIHERKTRFTFLRMLPQRNARSLRRSLIRALVPLPRHLCRSITYDNGSENSEHLLVNKRLGTRSFFCAPFHSWEKGSVENLIGVLRRVLPKDFNFDHLSPAALRRIERWANGRPRKCLAFRTPSELFAPRRHCLSARRR